MDGKTCIVLGASSQTGSWLVPLLLRDGWNAHLVSRGLKPRTDYGGNAVWHAYDLKRETSSFPAVRAEVVFDTLGAGSSWLGFVGREGTRRVVKFSSSSVVTKVGSTDPVDARAIAEVTSSERIFAATCDRLGIAWTVFRPTLIYGGKFGDRTVQDIAHIIRLLGFFPIFGEAAGLRQPVHAEDLAIACQQVCDNERTFGRTYAVAGGETLSYREMVQRIFEAMGRTPRFLKIPLPVFELAAKAIRLHPRYAHIRASMAKRMQEDMTVSIEDARLDFGYAPRRFAPVVRTSSSAPTGRPDWSVETPKT